jgi:hypothetical protein
MDAIGGGCEDVRGDCGSTLPSIWSNDRLCAPLGLSIIDFSGGDRSEVVVTGVSIAE